ncbi:hypothetical protein CDD83_3360 [Cordyceps sp. RAO-2017]|nr:hypothetical protein CDD83_3360 [Cordyceps sp. RAO-2017]
MVSSSALLALVAALAGAAAATKPKPDCRKVCYDGFNKCGQPFGICYNPCRETPPPPPPCTSTSKPTPTPTPTPVDDCRTRTVCIDMINSCGMMYGTCVADCKPWPTLTPPPCPSSTFATVTSKPTY